MSKNNTVLFRLKDFNDESFIRAFYTNNPKQFLEMYHFCSEEGIAITIPEDYDNGNDKYNGEKEGYIEQIQVIFGEKDTFPCVDIWLKDIF